MTIDYWNALDQRKAIHVDPERIGISVAVNKKALEQLKPRISEGAVNVELGFTGVGKGSLGGGGITPEMHGKTEREEVRELAKINKVTPTVHASLGMAGFAGLTKEGFMEEARQANLNEIKRTVDFAADIESGGPIVVHTGEFPRPVFEADKKFEAYPEEYKKGPVEFVDTSTGKLQSIPREHKFVVPETKKVEGKEVPVRYEEDTDEHRKGEIKWKHKSVYKIEKDFEKKKDKLKESLPQFIYREIMEKDMNISKGEAERWMHSAEEAEREWKVVKKEIDDINDQFKKNPKVAKLRAKTILQQTRMAPIPDTPDYEKFKENPIPFLEELEKSRKRQIGSFKEIADSSSKRMFEMEQTIKNTKPVEEYAVEKSAETIADAGMYAFDRTKKQKLEKPLFIAPENVFPEQYGAHPRELRDMIVKSREAMVKKLVDKRSFSKAEAKEVAKDHIKATFDVGHAYTWKKYFKGKPEDFDKWLLKQVKDLQKEGIIGHVHIADNFGYHDEHLAPGEGSVPIQDFVKEIEKEGYKGKMIAEWGAQPEQLSHQVMTGAWRTLNSPIYKVDTPWSDIEQSYLGRVQSPTFVVGDYAPSKDWTLWSEIPLE